MRLQRQLKMLQILQLNQQHLRRLQRLLRLKNHGVRCSVDWLPAWAWHGWHTRSAWVLRWVNS